MTKPAFALDYPAALREAQRYEDELPHLIQPDMAAHNMARALLLADGEARKLREVERIMRLTHRQMNIEWTRLGMKWDGNVSIQAARVWMIDKVLNGSTQLVTSAEDANG